MTNTVVLTGAGISTAAGVPDFRGPQGVWTRDPDSERMFHRKHFVADRTIRERFWTALRGYGDLPREPTPAHRALAQLERAGRLAGILTQNVDGLHQRAGSSYVLELHGTLTEVVCLRCGDRTPMAAQLARPEPDPPCAACGGILKPAAVLFGEHLDRNVFGRAANLVRGCDLLLVLGSSLQVEPAAGLCATAVECGAKLVIVNAEPTPYDTLADEVGTDIDAVLGRLTAG